MTPAAAPTHANEAASAQVSVLRNPLAPTIFHQSWWLDTVAPDHWQVVEAANADGKTVGRFPFTIDPVWGRHTLCGMPILTHFLGPAIDDGRGAACNRILKRAQITRQLLERVPATSGFWQKLHRGTGDALVYQELGFATAVQFTFEIRPAPEAALWSRMRDKTRNVIRRAEESLHVAECASLADFAQLYLENLKLKQASSYYPPALIERICREATSRGQGRVIEARDQSGRAMAAIFYVWDAEAAYYLLSTRHPDAHNGAVSLLLWHAIRDIARRGLVFDFEGVVTSGSALFFTGFGGEISPRYVVGRHTLGHKIAGRLANPWRSKAVETYL